MSNSTLESWASRSCWPEHGLLPGSGREVNQVRSQRPVGHGYNLAMEMMMSARGGEHTERSATTAAVGVTYWATEFERVYLMTAARIRGKRALIRRGVPMAFVPVPTKRDFNWLRAEMVGFIRTQLVAAAAS